MSDKEGGLHKVDMAMIGFTVTVGNMSFNRYELGVLRSRLVELLDAMDDDAEAGP